jgi:hypothetical protein
MGKESNNKQHYKNKEKDFGNANGLSRDPTKSEYTRNNSNNKEYNDPSQHIHSPLKMQMTIY